MIRTLLMSILLFCVHISYGHRRLVPAENASLHYRIVGFSVPEMPGTGYCTLELSAGSASDDRQFDLNIIMRQNLPVDSVIAEVPSFGSQYTWRISWPGSKDRVFHHFSTLSNPLTDSFFRLTVTKPTMKYADAYVFADCSRSLHDMNGNVVWFLPVKTANDRFIGGIQDLKCTVDGTITYIREGKMYEMLYDGTMLQSISDSAAPNSKGEIHHEVNKLSNGHYMLLGKETVYWKMENDRLLTKRTPDTVNDFKPHNFGTVSEYDENGKPVWHFCPADYIFKSDLMNRRNEDGFPLFEEHLNAFSFDEQKKVLFIGYRNVSRIFKVSYPDGKVLADYGARFGVDGKRADSGLFCHQHALHWEHGQLLVYNNNDCRSDGVPTIELLEEDSTLPDGVKTAWEYSAPYGPMFVERSAGGNIERMRDGSVFVSLSVPFNSLFIVDRNKVERWRALPEFRPTTDRPWGATSTYRASHVPSSAFLRKMIFFGEQRYK